MAGNFVVMCLKQGGLNQRHLINESTFIFNGYDSNIDNYFLMITLM